MQRGARRPIVMGLVLSLLASCSGNGPSEAEPAAPTMSPEPTAPVAPTTTSTPTTIPASTSTSTSTTTTTTTTIDPDDLPIELDPNVVAAVADDEPCLPEWSPLTTDEVTFTRNGNIFSYQPSTGELRCLATIDREPERLDWNPAGDRLLIDSDLILTETGVGPSGFAPDTVGITWSQPTGSALIAPSPDGSALVHVDADRPTRIEDVSSLATTWTAAYHPSGLAIVSAGIADDGQVGIFIADNHGDDPRPLVILDDQSTSISEVVFGHNGDWIAFIHDHSLASMPDDPVMGHVHRLFLPFLAIDDLGSYFDSVPSGLVTSGQIDGTVAWTVAPGGRQQATVMAEDARVTYLSLPSLTSTPVGFLDSGTSATLLAPTVGGAGADLWLYPTDAEPTLVTRGVAAETTRTVHDPNWSEPPLDIEQRAVG